MHLRSNKKTIQNLALAFTAIADGIESIENMIWNTSYHSADAIECNIKAYIINLEHAVKHQGLIRQDCHINYTVRYACDCVHIDVDPASLYRSIVMEWMEDPTQTQQEFLPLEPQMFGQWKAVPDFVPIRPSRSLQPTPTIHLPDGNYKLVAGRLYQIHDGIPSNNDEILTEIEERVDNFKLD